MLETMGMPARDLITQTEGESLQHQRTYIFTPADWVQVEQVTQADRSRIAFDGDPISVTGVKGPFLTFDEGFVSYRVRLYR